MEPQGHDFLLASPNLRMLVSSAKSAPLSEVKGVSLSADGIAYAASTLKGTNKIPSREAESKALCSANYLHRNAKNKAPIHAKSEVTTTSLPKPFGAKVALAGGAKSIASPSEAYTTDEVVLKSPVLRKKSSNAKVLQPDQPSKRSLRVSVLDHLSLLNPDLREFLTNKHKFC